MGLRLDKSWDTHIVNQHPNELRGHSQMTSAERGREGGYPITDAVREVA